MESAFTIFRWVVIGFVGVVFLTLIVLFALKAMGILPRNWGEGRRMDGRRSDTGWSSGTDSGSSSRDDGGSDSGGGCGGGGD